MDGIAAYYDNLARFLDVARRIGRGGGAAQGSTHRFLASEAGAASPEQLDHLVMDAAAGAGLAQTPRVLDAGCGIGGTVFRWHERFGGTYEGLTLSREQRHRAEAEAHARGVGEACRFHLRSYHHPIPDTFHAAVAIESLAHSPEPDAALANIAGALKPGGVFVIVDDMPEGDAQRKMRAAFKSHWRCPVLLDEDSYRAAIARAGLSLVREQDLTPRLRPRPLFWLKILIAAFTAARAISPTCGSRDVCDALLGGFILEALYRKNAMRYRLLVAVKPRA